MLCGIDLGTSSVKVAIVDEHGALMGFGKSVLGHGQGGNTEDLRAEPSEWSRAAAEACRLATSQAAETDAWAAGRRVMAVAVSGNGPTLVAVDRDGRPVGRALSWLDRSSPAEADRASALAGHRIDPSSYLPKALRLFEEDRKGPGSIARFFSGPEYLAHTLGAAPASYLADPYYERYTWHLEVAAALGMEASLFPPYMKPAQVMGETREDEATLYGLPAGIPIVSAYPDFLAALVGSNTTSPGQACDRTGSSEALNLCATKPFTDERLFSLPHAVGGLWNVSGGLSTSGKALEWYASAAGYTGQRAAELFPDFAAAAPGAGGVMFLPYLAGERAPLWDPALRGAFTGLSLSTGRREMTRAVVESFAYGLRLVANRMRDGGLAPRTVRCSGGAAHNDALNALKANVLAMPVETNAIPDCEPVGDACACAVALGLHPDLATASAAMAKPRRTFHPDPELVKRYDEGYHLWREALEAVSGMGKHRA